MKTLTMKEKINNEYFRIKELLEQRPTRVELFTYMEDSIYQYCMSHAKENPFEDVLSTWKEFFSKNKNWKDFASDMTYDKYLKITDKQHLAKAKTMPIKYLKASGKGFFVEKEGFALALNENLKEVIKNKVFVDNMRDVLEYRTIEYYRRRYSMNKLLVY